jgi:penicillin-binding protein 1A
MTNKNRIKKIKKTESLQNDRLKKTILKTLLYLVITLFIYTIYCIATLPNLEKTVNEVRIPSTTIIAENGNEITSYGTVFSEVVTVEEIPEYVSKAIIATEDRRFYTHIGFDPRGFTRAMLVNLRKMRYAQGGSTITQQVAKNLFLTRQKTIKRKVQELLLAFWLEYKLEKNQILSLYLNRVFLGKGTYGIEAASQRYFDKSSRDLTLLQSAIIAGMLKAPSKYNPIASEERAINRAKIVMNNMLREGYVTQTDIDLALKTKIFPAKDYRVKDARYFSSMVNNDVNSYVNRANKDILVYTTLSQEIQEAAQDALSEVIEKNKHRNVTQGAIVVIDKFGAIKALVGGVDYTESQFNRATQALRQAGSAFKSFVYLTAIENGLKEDDIVIDEKIQIRNWSPENYSKKFEGEVRADYAFYKSINSVAAKLGQKYGIKNVIKNAKKMGITTRLNNHPSLALGAGEVKVIDIATAYATFSNEGYSVWPYSISEIYSKDGYQLYSRISNRQNRILDKEDVKAMDSLLTKVVKKGTGKRASLPFKVAGKTGTSQDYRDAWFVGYSDKYICAVWLGNDDNTPMNGITGGSLPAQIWKKVMKVAQGQ